MPRCRFHSLDISLLLTTNEMMMNALFRLAGIPLLCACSKSIETRGPALAMVENVVIVDTLTRNPDEKNAFILTNQQAADFLNSAQIVSGREIHDYHSVGSDSFSGTATIGGMDFKWSITNGGTGSLTRELDGEVYKLADPEKREPTQVE